LVFGHVADLGDVEIFELGLQVQSLGVDGVPEALEDLG
jgi:hypothetical protein